MNQTVRFVSSYPIEKVEWGRFVICGEVHGVAGDGEVIGAGKDIIVYQNKVVPWHQRKGHLMTREILFPALNLEPDILIIGNGFNGMLEVPDALTAELMKEKPITIIVSRTPEACGLYNDLFTQNKDAVLAAHATC